MMEFTNLILCFIGICVAEIADDGIALLLFALFGLICLGNILGKAIFGN